MHGRDSKTKPIGRRSLTAVIEPARSHPQRCRTTLEDKIAILDFIQDHPSLTQVAVAKHFQQKGFPTIGQETISRIIRDGEKHRNEAKNKGNLTCKSSQPVKYPEVETALVSWARQEQSEGRQITGKALCNQARHFATILEIDPEKFLSLSNGWVYSFTRRHDLKLSRSYKRASSITHADNASLPSPHSAGSPGLESTGLTSMQVTPLNEAMAGLEINASTALPGAPVPIPLSPSSGSSISVNDSMMLLDDVIGRIPDNPIKPGHFCDVFEGQHVTAGKVALKRPRIGLAGYNETIIRRFEREAATWHRLRHPHILEFYGTLKRDGHIYFVSPFIENGTLADYVAVHTRINRIKLLCGTADAVQYLHKEGIIHGDLKARNILVDNNGNSRLCDFGLTKLASSATSTAMRGAGTVRWQSLELWKNAPKSFQSDVYAFSMTIVEVLTGKIPFSDLTTDEAVIYAVVIENERPVKVPTESSNGISYGNIWEVAASCWSKDPTDRISMSEAYQRIRADPSLP